MRTNLIEYNFRSNFLVWRVVIFHRSRRLQGVAPPSIQDDCRINIPEQTPCGSLPPDRNKLEHTISSDISASYSHMLFLSYLEQANQPYCLWNVDTSYGYFGTSYCITIANYIKFTRTFICTANVVKIVNYFIVLINVLLYL